MKALFKIASCAALITGLSACETIDEARYASVECKDLKQLMASENLASLSAPTATGLYRTSDDRENNDLLNVLDLSDKDKKRRAEMRAAYRNNCR